MERLAERGSTLYVLTWKTVVTPLGRRVYLLQASARPMSDNAFSSWPTPLVNDSKSSAYSYSKGDKTKRALKLLGAAQMVPSGWATPAAPAAREAGGTPEQFLARKVKAAAAGASLGIAVTSLSMQAQLVAPGLMSSGPPVATEKAAPLNPELSRWLMGYPPAWESFAPMATPSSRKSPPNSLKPLSTPSLERLNPRSETVQIAITLTMTDNEGFATAGVKLEKLAQELKALGGVTTKMNNEAALEGEKPAAPKRGRPPKAAPALAAAPEPEEDPFAEPAAPTPVAEVEVDDFADDEPAAPAVRKAATKAAATPAARTFTDQELMTAFKAYATEHGNDAARGILRRIGVAGVKDIPQAQRAMAYRSVGGL